MTVIKSHDAEQHASIGKYVGAFVTVDLQKLNKRADRIVGLVDCSRRSLVLYQQQT